eukprot:TRINITY_DN21000_c0_g1_i1.p1 TRINITY_DN21000_c0_g1~~TRINITY_DN21000_c0_g1_i1.p1  ORF type:complete len:533 (+),score=107.27 TRINITY_DN21000_c0_g1_i1:71-1669(+)
MGEFLRLKQLPQPRRVAELTPEAADFKALKVKASSKESSRVVSLAFSPVEPYRLAIASGTKVGLWQKSNDGTWEAMSSISKFKDVTQIVAWRNDGKLLLAGEASGSCAVVAIDTRKVLRRFRGHGDAVTCAAFSNADRSRAATGSRDGKLRLWDVTTCELLLEVQAHSDCMKSLSPLGGPDEWISAGYDGHIKAWDLRIANTGTGGSGSDDERAVKSLTGVNAKKCCVASMDHGQQVETGVVFPGGAMYASAGGTSVKLWDLASGGKPVQALESAHSKAVTGLSLDADASTLLTASFDGLVKAYHAASLTHLWTYKLPGPGTCVSWRPDGNAFAVGLDDGQWQLRERKTAAQIQAAAETAAAAAKQKKPFRLREGRQRGKDHKPESDDEVVDLRPVKRKMSQIDFFLKHFEYRKALEHMTDPNTPPASGMAIVDELLQRGALRVTLQDVGEQLCLRVLRWLVRCFGSGDTLQEHLLFEALHTLLDNNICLQPPSTPELHEVFERLEQKVHMVMREQEGLFETSGMLDMVMNL